MSDYPSLKAYFPESLTMYQQIKNIADSGFIDEYINVILDENQPYQKVQVLFGAIIDAYEQVNATDMNDEEKSTLLSNAIKAHIKYLDLTVSEPLTYPIFDKGLPYFTIGRGCGKSIGEDKLLSYLLKTILNRTRECTTYGKLERLKIRQLMKQKHRYTHLYSRKK